MYAVRCPHCMRLLQLNRPVENTKMKCRNCGQVFVGTTMDSPGEVPPPAEVLGPAGLANDPAAMLAASMAAPPRPRRSAKSAKAGKAGKAGKEGGGQAGDQAGQEEEEDEIPDWRRAKPTWKKYMPVTITGVVLVMLVVLAIFTGYVLTHPTVEIHIRKADVDYVRKTFKCGPNLKIIDEYGDMVVLKGPASRSEAPGLYKLAKEGVPAADRPMAALPPLPAGGGDTSSSGRAAGPDSIMEPLPDSDPNVEVMMTNEPRTRDESMTSGFLVGTLHNKAEYPVEQVELDVYTHDSNGKRRDPIHAKCAYIPAGGTVRICTIYSGLQASEVQRIGAVAKKPVRAVGTPACWMLENLTRQVADGKLTWTGDVVNPNDFAVKNVKIYYEVFEPDGVQQPGPEAIKEATLDGGVTTLGPKATGKVTITFDLAAQSLTAMANRLEVVARVWAQQ